MRFLYNSSVSHVFMTLNALTLAASFVTLFFFFSQLIFRIISEYTEVSRALPRSLWASFPDLPPFRNLPIESSFLGIF